MKRLCGLCLLILITPLCLFSESFVIPSIHSGLEITSIGNSVTYRMDLEYGLFNHKKALENGDYALLLPIPSSSEYQKVTVLNTNGFVVQEVLRDETGNCILLSEPMARKGLPDFVRVGLEIEKQPIKMSIPPSYYYEMRVDPDIIDSILNSDELLSRLPDLSFEVDADIDFSGLLQVAETFQLDTDEIGEKFEKIYNTDIQEFFPVDRGVYLQKAVDFLAVLAENGIGGRIARGFSFPPDIDTYREDFVVQVFLPEHGMLVFDRKLELFSDEYHFIEVFYTLSEARDFTYCGYVGLASGNILHVLEEPIYLSCGISDEQHPLDLRLKDLSYKMRGFQWGERIYDEMVHADRTIKTQLFRTTFKMSDEKKYFDVPIQYRVADIIFSKKLDGQYDPIEISNTYTTDDKVYATIQFKGSGYEKQLVVRWRSPSGDVFHTTEDNVKTTWTSYFNAIRLNSSMEKGIWTVEIVLNGALEMRKQFELK